MISEQEQALIDSIDPDELVALTRELVRIDSVIRPETGNTESKAVEFIADWIRRVLGIEPLVEEVEPGRTGQGVFFRKSRNAFFSSYSA